MKLVNGTRRRLETAVGIFSGDPSRHAMTERRNRRSVIEIDRRNPAYVALLEESTDVRNLVQRYPHRELQLYCGQVHPSYLLCHWMFHL